MRSTTLIIPFTLLLTTVILVDCKVQQNLGHQGIQTDTIRIGDTGSGLSMQIEFINGPAHNHPTFAIWMEDMDQKYLSTLFVTKSIATGIFGHGSIQKEVWDNKPGPQQRPATLPYWLHKRSEALNVPLLPDPTHPVLDGYTGATPLNNFVITTGAPKDISHKVRIMMEINQPWDWNEYWTNSLYDDPDYRTSCQPSLVYSVTVDLDKPGTEYFMNPIGHGQYAGKDGLLYTDLRTLTTALKIIDHVSVKLVNLEGK